MISTRRFRASVSSVSIPSTRGSAALSRALDAHGPGLQSQSIVYHGRVNVANAVALEGGLITPVIRDANLLDVTSLNNQWKELVSKVWRPVKPCGQ